MLEITPLYAALLAIIFLPLFVMVSKERSDLDRSIGYDMGTTLHLRVRRHGNFVEWIPFVLILMAGAEIRGMSDLWLHICGVLIVLGRLIHPIGLRVNASAHPLRIVGNTGGMLPMIIFLVSILYSYL